MGSFSFSEMAPAMKTPVKAMSKGALADALATQCELKKAVCSKVLDTLAGVATKEVKKTGVFSVPGLCRLKIRTKPATKAGKREVFSKVVTEDCESVPSCRFEGKHLKY